MQLYDFTKSFFNGPLTGLTLTAGGSGYTTAPTVTISGGGGSGATATAALVGGAVDSLTLTDPGTGYFYAPTVTLAGDGSGATAVAKGITLNLEPKAIHDEMSAAYDIDYGRMSGMMGLELPVVNSLNQNMVLYGYSSPPVDNLRDSLTPLGTLGDGTQIWKITQNGVDTHPIHVHLVNAQLINRVAWDGALLPPEPNELGWKETFRVNPLEHAIIAMRPMAPTVPFDVPNSIRLIDPSMPADTVLRGGPAGFIDPEGIATTVTNHEVNYGWEYVWHCHILSHEEMDMMHAMPFAVAPKAPAKPTAQVVVSTVGVTWDDVLTATSYIVQRATDPAGPWADLSTTVPTPVVRGTAVAYVDAAVPAGTYYYRVLARNTVGDTTTYAGSLGYPTTSIDSEYSPVSDAVLIPV